MSSFAYLVPLAVWLGVLAVCIVCTYIAWRAMFGDRGLNKRRCPRCWYDMAYSPGMTCAECGHVVSSEVDFQRTRRRPGVAAAAIFICVALVLGVNDQMNDRGLLRHAPTAALLWLLPISGGMDSAVGREVDRRAVAKQLSADQWLTLMERCAAGGWTTSPPDDDWIIDYGNYITSWRLQFMNDAVLEAPLLNIPPRFEVTTRDTWPLGASPALAVRLEDWWPAGMECRVRAVPRLAGAQPITFFRSGETRFRPSPFTMYLPPLSSGASDVTIDFTVDRRRMAGIGRTSAATTSWEPVGAYAVTLHVKADGRIDDLMKPNSSAALDLLVQQVFGNAVRWTGGGLSPVRFGINVPATFTADFDDTAMGVCVELRHDGVVARRLNLWWIAGTATNAHGRNYGFEINYENLELLRQLETEDGWSLHIRGDPMLALRAGQAGRYWQGEVTVPINLRTNDTQAPPRMWWIEGEQAEQATSEE